MPADFPEKVRKTIGEPGTVWYFGEEKAPGVAVVELPGRGWKMHRPPFHDGWYNATEEAASRGDKLHPYRMLWTTLTSSPEGRNAADTLNLEFLVVQGPPGKRVAVYVKPVGSRIEYDVFRHDGERFELFAARGAGAEGGEGSGSGAGAAGGAGSGGGSGGGSGDSGGSD